MGLYTFKDTVFEKYDTIIFDLDETIWSCLTPDGKSLGAYRTVPPYTLEDSNTIRDLQGNIIKLHPGFLDFIRTADQEDKNLGIVSKSEVVGLFDQAQPAIMLLKRFRIYKYFNHEIVLKLDMDKKSEYVKPLGKTLYIDDEKQHTDDVNNLGSVDVLWRPSFQNWNNLLNNSLKFQ